MGDTEHPSLDPKLNIPEELREENRKQTQASLTNHLTEGIAKQVNRQFEGVSKVLSERHLETVLNYRSVYQAEQMLNLLSDKLPHLLDAAGSAVAKAVRDAGIPVRSSEVSRQEFETLQSEVRRLLASGEHSASSERARVSTALDPEEFKARLEKLSQSLDGLVIDSAAVGQIALAASQAVQQTAFNVQKIITVAIEASRSSDGVNPKYVYPP